MAGKKTVPEKVEAEIVSEVTVEQPEKMEFRLINPTEDGFLREIKWNKEELEEAVRHKISAYQNVVYTEDNMKQAKADRAGLNNLIKVIEERRKMVKKKINEPYEVFESELKDILAQIREPVEIIDRQIKAFEDQQKEDKKKSIRTAYDEVIGDLAEFLPFERVFDSRYLNQTCKLVTAQSEVKEKVEKVRTDLETIDSLESKYKLNAKDVYIKTLDLSKALAENKRLSDLEEKLEAEKRRREAEEAERKRREAEEEAERKRREEERRKAAEEKAMAEEEQRKALEDQKKSEEEVQAKEAAASAGSLPFDVQRSGNSMSESRASVIKQPENVIEGQEGGTLPRENGTLPMENGSEPVDTAAVSDPFAPQESQKQYKASFTVYGTKDQIMAVRQFMVDNNIKFGKVEK